MIRHYRWKHESFQEQLGWEFGFMRNYLIRLAERQQRNDAFSQSRVNFPTFVELLDDDDDDGDYD